MDIIPNFYGILTLNIMHTSKTVEVLAVAYIGGRGAYGVDCHCISLYIYHGDCPVHPVKPAGIAPVYLHPCTDPGDDILPRRIFLFLRYEYQKT